MNVEVHYSKAHKNKRHFQIRILCQKGKFLNFNSNFFKGVFIFFSISFQNDSIFFFCVCENHKKEVICTIVRRKVI